MKILIHIFAFLLSVGSFAQLVPSTGENIDFIITSGQGASSRVGDDDHQQVFFFLVPTTYTNSFYIRVFDPETGGENDEISGEENTTMTYTLYGGVGTHSDTTSRSIDVITNQSGKVIQKKEFTNEAAYDNKWFNFGPLNPREGELDPYYKGYIFKLVVDGGSGNDVNLYRFSLSSSQNDNIAIPSGNAFTYEYAIRLKSKKQEVTHLYPYIDENVVSITQSNFDFDSDGKIMLFSNVKKGLTLSTSGNGNWKKSKHEIVDKEKGKCLDYQIQKRGSWHNDMVVFIVNQYDTPVPFFAVPLGGVPELEVKFQMIRQGAK